jgi:hypothetical protein
MKEQNQNADALWGENGCNCLFLGLKFAKIS